jgi:hypothetical protein
MNVVWNNDKWLIVKTREEDAIFTPEGLFQIYKRIGESSDWERYPDYHKTGTIQWFKSLKSAKSKIKSLGEV